MAPARLIPLPDWRELPEEEMLARSRAFLQRCRRRRTVREFSEKPVPAEIVRNAILAAGTAPSGAHRQPWHFVAVGRDPALRRRLREAAEEEELRFYHERAPREWLEALERLGTDENKPFLETAPWLIAVFAESYRHGPDGTKRKNYYVSESVGIATGILVAALHDAGLASLTHTPSPMGFLNDVLGRPANERPFLLLVVGYPAEGATVPDIRREPLERVATFLP